MALTAGNRLGPYEIVSPLGAGGMGEVYKARDTRLERTVAIKILPSHLSDNPDLKQRFQREAKAISSFQHPHICTLYDIGSQDGVDFLVMECLEGETLADRLVKGPLKIDEAVKVAIELADALDKAHRQGIVHRDLKPGNIMLTKSGAKLMDFGLAKSALAIGTAASHVTPNTPTMSVAALTSPASPLTQKGTIVGTFQYMAPEVLQGADADARSDIFSLGCVLYEMVTGRRAFEGKSQVSVLAAILDREPEPVSTVQPLTPPALEFCIRTCLAKDPEERFQTARDVTLQLRWASVPTQTVPQVPTVKVTRGNWWMLAAAIVIALLAAGGTYWFARPGTPQVIESVIPTPDKTVLDAMGDFAGPVVISPDGQAIAFAAHSKDGQRALWVRRLADTTAQRLEGTEEASFPFWSPDSRFIAFFAKGKLNKVSASGGPVLAIADAPSPRGGSWGKGDVIVFEPDFQSALLRVSGQGGEVKEATTLDSSKHTTHRWPWFLPDGKHFLFLATNHSGGVRDQNGVYMGSLDSKETHMIVGSDSGAQFANGYLVFHSQNALMAQRFDPTSGKLSGEAMVIMDHVAHDPGVWRTIFSVSATGILAYQAGAISAGSELVFVDRTGKELGHLGERGQYSSLRASPDGKRVAVALGDPKSDLWMFDLTRGTSTRLTFESGAVDNPAWSADGSTILYNLFPGTKLGNSLNTTSSATIYMKRSDGSGTSKLVWEEPTPGNAGARPAAMAPQELPDGKAMLYIQRLGPLNATVNAVPLDGSGKSTVVIAPASSQANIVDFRLSPDGHWLAYTSNESGRLEAFVVPYPNTSAGKWQVSTEGGQFVTWRGDNKELYFFGVDNRLYAASFSGGGTQPEIGTPQPLFSIPNTAFNGFYEAMPDGKRFLINRIPVQESTPVSLLVNWPELLKRR